MLKLSQITKIYKAGDTEVEALKKVSLNFRKNEFVSILGPSGCGKTTLLNIIGGLDKYTDGDLIINGVSTKEYKDSDWDLYRNHRIGFIFQSYNLIPHQTILGNVELALTIAGIDKAERIAKAKKALDRVGLKDQYYKRPNQLSGGQCQRVAIARALVNEPDILLADEPTGALDTVTSVQIMDLIKEISSEKLVIMVTHNPELAEKYSTRIVRLLDGEISSDSNICNDEEEIKNISEQKDDSKKKAKMSFSTAFKLSSRNLISKIKRTLLVGLAGSIGIIGVSLVLALSSGIKDYIDNLQEDMLSGNPITIAEESLDINAMMGLIDGNEKVDIIQQAGLVNVNSILEQLAKRSEQMSSIRVTNEINQNYIDYLNAMPKEYLETIGYNYGFDVSHNIYTEFTNFSDENKNQLTSLATIKNIYRQVLVETDYKESATLISTLSQPFSQALDNADYINKQYDLLDGKIATEKDEIMIVVSKDRQLTDLTLAQLGYYNEEAFLNMVYKAFNPELYNPELSKDDFSYQELLNKKFYLYSNNSIYLKNNGSNPMKPATSFPFFYNPYVEQENSALELKVVGILQPKENMNYGSLSTGFFYTSALIDYIKEINNGSDITEHVKNLEDKKITSVNNGTFPIGICYEYAYGKDAEGNLKKATGLAGNVTSESLIAGMLGGMGGGQQGGGQFTNVEIRTISLRDLGGEELPNSISIYPVDFDQKEYVLAYLDAWNNDGDITLNGAVITKDNRSKITYTDALSIVISMIDTMISAITTALVAFTAISLIVSTVMIGIITYVSVVERTKEIGVIRSLGGRKKDVAHLFNAETFIIGGVAGLFGLLITYLVQIVGNIIIYNITSIRTLVAFKWHHALIMLSISIVLTLISGLIPSRAAAKMDPVNALRTE